MKFSFLFFKKIDWFLIFAIILISLISLFTIYSSITDRSLAFFYVKKQILFLIIGFIIFLFLTFFDYRVFKNYSSLILAIYIFNIFLLVLTLLVGQKIRGAASWLDFGFFKFQSVELTKFSLLLLLAKYFSQRHIEIYRFIHILISGVYVGLPTFLVLVQPDFGSAIILVVLWFFIIIASGVRLKHLLIIFFFFFLILGIFWSFVFLPYQKARIISFFNPQKDPLGAGYNLIQSLIAIGNGGIIGKGLGKGLQVQKGFLPEAHTDFIFAAFAEEWGFLGVLFLLSLYFIVIWRLIIIMKKLVNNFSLLFIFGFIIILVSQLFINIGMNIALFPITGISLPFLSYGGSNLILFFSLLGISQSIRIRT